MCSQIRSWDKESILASVYPLLASSINIGIYSYEYEVMQAGQVTYSEPTGIAVNHLQEGAFNYQSFYQAWFDSNTLSIVQGIADKHFPEIDSVQQPQLLDALLEAFTAGKNSQ